MSTNLDKKGSKEEFFNNDQPITNIEDDKLERKGFSHDLATAICKYKGNESFVIGLTGEWGSGKTSIMNMVEKDITTLESDLNSNLKSRFKNVLLAIKN